MPWEFIRVCIDIAISDEGYEYVATINEKSEEVEFEQTKSTLDGVYGFDRSELESVDATPA